MRQRAVLLNPPGPQMYLRDYFCSKVAKGRYCDHPLDLLMLSGTLAQEYEVALVDGIAERLTASAALHRLKRLAPDVIVFLAGAASWETDRPFLERAAALTGATMLGIADFFYGRGAEVLHDLPWLHAVLYDFSSDVPLRFLRSLPTLPARDTLHASTPAGGAQNPIMGAVVEGKRLLGAAPPALENCAYRLNGAVIGCPTARTRGEMHVPLPRHDLFVGRRYSFPFIRHTPFATLLTEYGCVYRCPYCINGLLGYKPRPLADVEAELDLLARMGVRDLWIRDLTFGARPERARALCRLLGRRGFGWVCYSRADVLSDALVRAMRRGGCHTIMMGVESGDDALLARYKRGLTRRRFGEVFEACRRLGVRTVASFMIGFPEEGPAQIERTIDLALSIPCDFASFNLVVPRAGTAMREAALVEKLIGPDEVVADQSGTRPSMATRFLSKEALAAWRRRAERRFYLRPGYLLRRLAALRSPDEITLHVRNGLAVFYPRRRGMQTTS